MFGVQVVNLPREPMGREPLDHRLGVEERPIDPLGAGPQHTVKSHGTRHQLLLLYIRRIYFKFWFCKPQLGFIPLSRNLG